MGRNWRIWWRWMGFILAGFTILQMGRKAFGEAWTWNSDQIMVTILGTVIVAAIASWIYRWKRYGTEGVKARWREVSEVRAQGTKYPGYRQSLLIWIVIAVGLVIMFNMLDRH